MKIDTHRLIELFRNEETAQRFVQLFIEKLPGQLESIKDAIQAQDWEAVSTHAHSLKSQCRYVGLDAAADLLQSLENSPQAEVQRGLVSDILLELTL